MADEVTYDIKGNCDCHTKAPTYPVYRDNPHVEGCRYYKPLDPPTHGGGIARGFVNLPDPKTRNMTDAEKARAGIKNDFEFMMWNVLNLLEGLCGSFEQTTHGRWFTAPPTMEQVLEQLRCTYEEPTAYNISDLAQYIRAFQKASRWRR